MKQGFKHQTHTFESGLRLVTVPMPATKTATVLVLVGTGNKYETKDKRGISHFLEHLMFKGTTKRPNKMTIAGELDGIGADYNAFTGAEYTGYYARASASKVNILMDVVFDVFLNSMFDQKEIEIERGAIQQELNMYKDQPSRYAGELLETLMYGDQPAGWGIDVEEKVLPTLQRVHFVEYFQGHYIAANTVVVVAGNVDSEQIKEFVTQSFASVRQGPKLSKVSVVEQQTKPQASVFQKPTDQTNFHLAFRAVNMYDPRRYALSLLATIMGGGMSSRLWAEVREKRGLAYGINAGIDATTDTGMFTVSTGVGNDKALEALKVILEELARVQEGGVLETELQRAKNQAEGGMALGLENSRQVADTFAESLLFRDQILTPEQELATLQSVTREEVAAIAREVLQANRMNLSLVGPFSDRQSFLDILKL